MNMFLWELSSIFRGPYPSFNVTRDIVSDRNDAPAVRYYLWVKLSRFGMSKLAGIGESHKELAEIKEKWINVNQDIPI
jgi:hypothetical protein